MTDSYVSQISNPSPLERNVIYECTDINNETLLIFKETCEVSIQMSIQDHWPLVLTSSGDAFRKLKIENSRGSYFFAKGETAKVSCPGSLLINFETTEETIKCQKGRTFEVKGRDFDFSQFGCKDVSFYKKFPF